MPICARHRDDPIPTLAPVDGLTFRRSASAAEMAGLQGRSEREIADRFAKGHRAYLAPLHGEPAAWGWVARRTADIGELGTAFVIPSGERYLWNFVTRQGHRGMGIYPRLLDWIVRAESASATRFWIVYAPENHASGAGVRKAGFVALAELSFDRLGSPALAALVPGGDLMAARLLRVARTASRLAPCWRCVRAGRGAITACRDGECRCDYQEPTSGCAA